MHRNIYDIIYNIIFLLSNIFIFNIIFIYIYIAHFTNIFIYVFNNLNVYSNVRKIIVECNQFVEKKKIFIKFAFKIY